MAYAFKRGKIWWIGYTDAAGVPRREATREDNKTKAKALAIEMERKADRQEKGVEAELATDMTFAKATARWLEELPADYRSRQVVEMNLHHRILPYLGDELCRSIGREHVSKMLRANEKPRTTVDRKGKPLTLKKAAPGTLEKLRVTVHAIFEWLIEDLQVVNTRNPAGGKRMKVKVPKRLPRYIPVAELVPLISCIPAHHRLLFVFAVVSGMRKGELIPLVWSDVDLEGGTVLVSKSLDSDTTKGRKERVVDIPEWLVPAFIVERAQKRSLYVFPNREGKRHPFKVKLQRIMRTAATRAGLVTGYRYSCRGRAPRCGWRGEGASEAAPVCEKCGRSSVQVTGMPKLYRFKDLRSTFGTLAASQSGDIRFVQQVLGHASVTTTEGHYARALSTDRKRKMDGLDFGLLPAQLGQLAVRDS